MKSLRLDRVGQPACIHVCDLRERYRTRIREKLGLRSRAEMVDYALRLGMLATPAGAAGPDSWH